MNQQLIDYIKNQIKLGRSEDVIKSMLKSAGWQDNDIDEGFKKARGMIMDTDAPLARSVSQSVDSSGALSYNSQNLPLDPQKVIKKTIAKSWGWVILGLFIMITSLVFSFTRGQLLGLAMIVISTMPVFIYEYFYYKLYFYDFGDERAIIKKGVISRATGHVRYERLQNIYVDQDILDRIFGLYDVHYETAGEKSGFYSHVDGLKKENSDKLVAFLEIKAKQPIIGLNSGSKIFSPEALGQSFQKENEEIASEEISINQYPISKVVILTGTINMILFYFFISLFVISALLEEIGLQSLAKSWFIALGIFSVFAVFILIYNIIWYKNFYFNFSKDKGEIRTKVIGQSTSYLYYDRIQNINVAQGVIDRLFGIHRIVIETAGENAANRMVIIGLLMENAEKIKNFLLAKTRYYQNRL